MGGSAGTPHDRLLADKDRRQSQIVTLPAHGRELRVDPGLLEARFGAGCDTGRCNAACCRTGVWLDPAERDAILDHADLVRQAMDPGQPRDPRWWFSRRVVADPDFPSGRAVHTRVRNGRCVFLDRGGRCVLQKASSAGRAGRQLKPFFCTAFPVTVVGGMLMLDDDAHHVEPACCGSQPHRTADRLRNLRPRAAPCPRRGRGEAPSADRGAAGRQP
jgi:Fe-S-cluster containining protein